MFIYCIFGNLITALGCLIILVHCIFIYIFFLEFIRRHKSLCWLDVFIYKIYYIKMFIAASEIAIKILCFNIIRNYSSYLTLLRTLFYNF